MSPAPAVVSPDDIATGGPKAENYESVLVSVEDVTVTNADLGFGEFEVGGSLRVDDFFLKESGMVPTPAQGLELDAVIGPLLYSFDDFKVVPRRSTTSSATRVETGMATATATSASTTSRWATWAPTRRSR